MIDRRLLTNFDWKIFLLILAIAAMGAVLWWRSDKKFGGLVVGLSKTGGAPKTGVTRPTRRRTRTNGAMGRSAEDCCGVSGFQE